MRFYNTLGKKLEEFVPLKKGEVKLYTCGPTVYNYPHIGNYRAYIFEDLLRRYLKFCGFKVTQVMNLTDVDDKTIKGSQKERTQLSEFTKRYSEAFFEDMAALNIEHAEHYPRATEHIKEMVEVISKLKDKGLAYRADDGSYYFDVSKFKPYGKLSGVKIDKLRAGARIAQDEYDKDEAQDFALWKAWSKEDGKTFWETELGKGRPGWHIECSAMSMKYLGESFDIHTGGVDNIFPHHENEIAQSEGATGKPFVKYWLHCEHLIVDGKKMSKSLGNFYTLRDILNKGHDPIAIRYLLLSTHYRQPLNFTFKGLDAAKNSVDRLNEFIARLRTANGNTVDVKKLIDKTEKSFVSAMDDDLNISEALAAVFDFVRDINKLLDDGFISKPNASDIVKFLRRMDSVLDVMNFEEEKLEPELAKLIKDREAARKAKDFRKADQIRNQLKEKGIILKDTPQGARWKRIKQ